MTALADPLGDLRKCQRCGCLIMACDRSADGTVMTGAGLLPEACEGWRHKASRAHGCRTGRPWNRAEPEPAP